MLTAVYRSAALLSLAACSSGGDDALTYRQVTELWVPTNDRGFVWVAAQWGNTDVRRGLGDAYIARVPGSGSSPPAAERHGGDLQAQRTPEGGISLAGGNVRVPGSVNLDLELLGVSLEVEEDASLAWDAEDWSWRFSPGRARGAFTGPGDGRPIDSNVIALVRSGDPFWPHRRRALWGSSPSVRFAVEEVDGEPRAWIADQQGMREVDVQIETWGPEVRLTLLGVGDVRVEGTVEAEVGTSLTAVESGLLRAVGYPAGWRLSAGRGTLVRPERTSHLDVLLIASR